VTVVDVAVGPSVCLRNNKILNLIVQKQLPICQWIVISEWYTLVLEVLVVQLMGNVPELDDGIHVSTGYQTRCAANPTHYPWLQSLMKTRQTTYFHTR